ncbi:coxsackievirus and adenovirus receptor homolog [Brienomyrus brachyistius]|uniref:coxsackievirus and adenovirus receptor homolog n=1 Tax=Brienomyrus brachyistius TaxID=42636 RepID=UPI0020B378E2|nr:coxsackievirus and adenovirus receptor homolog [Brienomyrus brachyistius]
MSRFTAGFPVTRSCHIRPGPALCCVLMFYLHAGGTVALQVTSTGPQTIQKALGESVILGCEYSTGPSDVGDLDIEWTMVSPDITQKDQLILSFMGGTKYDHSTGALAEGVDFAATDPSQGDASIKISSLAGSNAGTYQCKVKKGPGADTRKVTLVVLVRPSEPKCKLLGSEKVGGALSLQCKSSEGSTPLIYFWRKGSEEVLPSNVTQNSVTGELFITNHSESTQGMYVCEVRNAVGIERCRFRLQAIKPPNRAGVIVGTFVGGLLLVVLLLLFIWFLFCLWDKRQSEKEDLANDIRLDVPSPLSRPPSRALSRPPSRALSRPPSRPPSWASGRRSDWAHSSFKNPSITRSLASGSIAGSFSTGRKSPDSWLLGARLESRGSYAV